MCLAANVSCVMSAGRGKFTPEMSNVVASWQHVSIFSESLISKWKSSTYIHINSYIECRYRKSMSLTCGGHLQLSQVQVIVQMQRFCRSSAEVFSRVGAEEVMHRHSAEVQMQRC